MREAFFTIIIVIPFPFYRSTNIGWNKVISPSIFSSMLKKCNASINTIQHLVFLYRDYIFG